MELNPVRTRFINDFFEEYVQLSDREEEILMKEISQMENAEAFMKLPNSWEERGIEKGREQAKVEVVLEMLKAGSTTRFISKVTHFEEAEIEKLRKENN